MCAFVVSNIADENETCRLSLFRRCLLCRRSAVAKRRHREGTVLADVRDVLPLTIYLAIVSRILTVLFLMMFIEFYLLLLRAVMGEMKK